MTEDASERAPQKPAGEMTPEEWREQRRRLKRERLLAQLESERRFHEERERAWREAHGTGKGGPDEVDVSLFAREFHGRLTVPQGRLPALAKPRKKGAVVSVSLHLVLILVIVLGPVIARRAMGNPGEPGGGGGGGGGRDIQFINLPPAAASGMAAVAREQEQAPPPEPVVEEDALTFPVAEVAVEEPVDAVGQEITLESLGLGVGQGTGEGPGEGTGSGGGTGSGEGEGIGSGVGDGSGGDGGDVYAPEPRTVVYPFEDPPEEIRGVELTVHFWVDRRGRVTKVEVSPAIKDSNFRKKLLDRMREWVFYPAYTVRGLKVEGEFIMTVTF